MRRILLGVFALGLGAGAGGCADVADRFARERDALQESVVRRDSEFGPLSGRYEGTLQAEDHSEPKRVSLVLVPMIMIVQNPGRNDVSEVLTLGGTLNLLVEDAGIEDSVPIAQFNTAKFEPETGRLRLSGSIQTGSTVGVVANSLDATVEGASGEGSRISGLIINSARGSLGWVEVYK